MKLQRKISSSCESCRKSCRVSVASISVESSRRPRPARGLPMRMTSVSFLSFCTKITACFRRWISRSFRCQFWIRSQRRISRNIWNIFRIMSKTTARNIPTMNAGNAASSLPCARFIIIFSGTNRLKAILRP